MADAYTSIKTTGGWSDNTVKAAWDLAFRLSLRENPMSRQFVDVRPSRLSHRGDSQTIQIEQAFSDADVKAALTPLDEEADVSATKFPKTKTVTLTPTEYGFAVSRTRKLANRSMSPLDPSIAREVAFHCARTVDRLIQTEMRTGTNVLYGGDATSNASLAAGDLITSALLREAVTEMNTNSVHPRSGGGAQGYVMLLHPRVVKNLREETGAGGWRIPKEYVDPSDIYSGEIGEYEGIRFVQSTYVSFGTDDDDATSGVRHYPSYLFGAEALAESVVEEPQIAVAPGVDRLGRFHTVGWYADIDFGIFRQEALYRFETAVS